MSADIAKVRVTRAQVRAARVVAALLASRGEPVPPSVRKIAEASVEREPLTDRQRALIADIRRKYREKRGDQ